MSNQLRSPAFSVRNLALPCALLAGLAVAPGSARAQAVCKADEVQVPGKTELYCMHVAPQPMTAQTAEAYCKARKQKLSSFFTLAALWNVNKPATEKLSPLVLDKKLVLIGLVFERDPVKRYKITTPVQGGLRNLPEEPYKAQSLHFLCETSIPLPK